jgi:hypothetical protein
VANALEVARTRPIFRRIFAGFWVAFGVYTFVVLGISAEFSWLAISWSDFSRWFAKRRFG